MYSNYKDNKYKNKVPNKIKSFFMYVLFAVSFLCIGAGLYKLYDDIDTSKYVNNTQMQRLSGEQSIVAEKEEKSTSDMIQEVIPTVVGISKLKNNGTSIFLQDSVTKLGLGTGVIISDNGYILTNQHVSGSKYSNCYVTLENGEFYNGNVVWSDSDLDLAIVKISAMGLDYINIGDSDAVKIEDKVYAIGNQIGLEF